MYGILTYILLIFMANVGIYTRPMDSMALKATQLFEHQHNSETLPPEANEPHCTRPVCSDSLKNEFPVG